MSFASLIKKYLSKKIKDNLDRNFIRKMLNILGRNPAAFFYGSCFSSTSDKYLNIHSMKIIRKAYSGRYPVAYGSLFAPYEMFHALGLIPFLPEAMAGFTAGLGVSDKTLKKASSMWYTPDLCTFHRSAAGAVELELFPEPDFLICTNLICDAAQKAFYIDARKYGKEDNFYLIDVPYYNNDTSIKYLAEQLKDISIDISEKMGSKLDMDKFGESIRLSNEFRNYVISINDIRKELIDYPKLFNGLNFILPFYSFPGSKEGVRLYKKIYQEFKKHLDMQNQNKPNHEPKKILWMHLKPYYKNSIFDILEKNNCIIAAEEFGYIYWPELDPEKPFESLALKMVSNFLNGEVSNRTDAIIDMIDTYNIDGVVQFSHWGCRNSNGGTRVIKDALKKKGIPMISLDGDCVNIKNSSSGQTNTRIEGFTEILNSR